MGKAADDSPSETVHLVERLHAGDRRALADLFQRHRDRLRRMVELRMDSRLQGRIDASDVLQDGFLDLAKRVESYLGDPRLPVFLWLRLVVSDRLATLHRHHLGTRMRDAAHEVSLYRDPLPPASSAAPGLDAAGAPDIPLGCGDPGRADPPDPGGGQLARTPRSGSRGIRHFEQLTRAETAVVLGITEEAGAKRYIRAMKKLKTILAAMPGGLEGP